MSREAHEWFYIFSVKKCLGEGEELKGTCVASISHFELTFWLVFYL